MAFVFYVLILGSLSQATQINPFQYDGCTFFTEGTLSQPKLWDHCCLEHDLFYWAGGTKKQRLRADQNLKQCFSQVGHPGLAELIYMAVRMGRHYPFPVRTQQWGNAWSVKRNYRVHSLDDIQSLQNELVNYLISPELKDKLINHLISGGSRVAVPESKSL
jgi:hypothetical protein